LLPVTISDLSFGDTKFIPGVPAAQFRAIITATSAQGALRDELLSLCDRVLPATYSLDPHVRELGFPDRPAVSTYYSPNVTQAQIELVNAFMAERDISPYNTRLMAVNESATSASSESKEESSVVLELRIAAGCAPRVDSVSKFRDQTIRYEKTLLI
jgi:hypothetical protein